MPQDQVNIGARDALIRKCMRLWLHLLTCSALALGDTALLHADEFMSKDVKIHYVVQGKGEPVILVHGLDSSAKMNWEMPGTVAELAKHYQVIAFDNRGHGQSDKPQAEGQYGVQMVEDVVRLMDHLNLPKAHVVGYSLGGMIALKLPTLHPERVSSAVLGGMGWLRTDTPAAAFLGGHAGTRRRARARRLACTASPSSRSPKPSSRRCVCPSRSSWASAISAGGSMSSRSSR